MRTRLSIILGLFLMLGLAGCDLDLTGLEEDLNCMVGSLDNHFPNERC